MKDLISRQKTIEEVHKYFDGLPIQGHYDMVQIIKNMPTIDAVPVVRCKDCKWKVVTKLKENYCLRCEDIVKDDYFCADGAKMDVSDNDVGKMERSEDGET